MSKRTTDMQKIKLVAKSLLMMPPSSNNPIFCSHPFANTPIIIDRKTKEMKNILEEDGFDCFVEQMTEIIDKAKKPEDISIFINKPYALTWYKLSKDYFSDEDYANLLRDCWMREEDPNQDINVTKKECISYFKHADNNYLMTDEEKEHFDSLSDDITLYRGVGINRCKYGLSWTDNEEIASWFSNRFKEYYEDSNKKDSNYILTCKAKKSWMLAYLNGRSEQEVVLDVYKAKNAGAIKLL